MAVNIGARRLLGWWLLAVLVAAGFAQLGRWQLARMEQKQAMLDAATAALDHAHPQPLLLASDSARAQDYDWAAGRGTLLDATLWLDAQQRAGRVGVRLYCVLLPDDGVQAVLVDAGWWPLAGSRELPQARCPAATGQDVRGLLAAPPTPGLVHGAALAPQGGNRWLASRMALPAVAAALGLRVAIAPRVLRLDPRREPGDAGVMAASGERDLDILPNTMLPERHLGYAVQWFGLALTVLVVAATLTFRMKKKAT